MEAKPDPNPETNRRLPMPRPAGFKIEKLGDELKITTETWHKSRWFGPNPKELLILQIVWIIGAAYLSAGLFSALSQVIEFLIDRAGLLLLLMVPIIVWPVSLILLAPTIYFLMLSLNKTIIIVTPQTLVIKHYPVFYPEHRSFAINEIKQLYVEERFYPHSQSFPWASYHLNALLKSNRHLSLVSNLAEAQSALYLEQEIEHFLRLENQPVPGEVGYTWYTSEINKRSIWKELAEEHHLDFILDETSGRAMICGIYRGYRLELSTFFTPDNHQRAVFYTRLTLKIIRPAQIEDLQLAFYELEDRLAVEFEPKGQILFNTSLIVRENPANEIRINLGTRGSRVIYERAEIETDKPYLQCLFDRMIDLATIYYRLARQGGEVVSWLQNIALSQGNLLQPVAFQLLQEIAQETTERLEGQAGQLICTRCLTACTKHQIILPRPHQLLTYYGCRFCGQSREFLPLKGSLVAVLDEQMTQKYVLQDETIYGNLLQQRQLFDFDAVHIRRASDEAVERFAIQVGNDTDPGRRPYYASMPCLIWSSCGLSENSIKILKRTFGQVEVKRVS